MCKGTFQLQDSNIVCMDPSQHGLDKLIPHRFINSAFHNVLIETPIHSVQILDLSSPHGQTTHHLGTNRVHMTRTTIHRLGLYYTTT